MSASTISKKTATAKAEPTGLTRAERSRGFYLLDKKAHEIVAKQAQVPGAPEATYVVVMTILTGKRKGTPYVGGEYLRDLSPADLIKRGRKMTDAQVTALRSKFDEEVAKRKAALA